MTRIIWNLDTGLFVRRNKMILKTTFLGPLCYWAWRIFLITIITFCGVNLIFVIFILLGSKSEQPESPDGLMHRKLEDIVYNKVHQEEELFRETEERLERTNFLFVTYCQDSLLLDLIARDEEIFLVDVNKKLAEHSPDLLLYWSRVTRTSLLTALSVIRNVFQCDSETDSLLVSRQERVLCQQAKYRAVHLSYLSLQQLEPLLQNFRSTLKVVIVQTDPRSVFYREEVKERPELFGGRMCQQMLRDVERMEEYGATNRNSFGLYIEELFYMKSSQTVSSLSTFLEVESLSTVKLQKSRLDRQLTKAYSWTSRLEPEAVKKIDAVCGGLYSSSVFAPLGSNNTVRRRNEQYPLKIDYQ